MTRNTDEDEPAEQDQSSDKDDYQSLEQLVREYLAARGKDNVSQVAVGRKGFQGSILVVTAHPRVLDELPGNVAQNEIITHHGYEYELLFEEDPYGPSTLGRITLYTADDINGMERVSLEDGLAAADAHMEDLINREELPRSKAI